jgi:RNA polymerase sigma-70 factor (ECF subfamily)
MSAQARAKSASHSDGELLAAIARGQLEALGALFDRHEPAVRRYLGRLGLAPEDADDLVQATFLEAHRAAPRFDAQRSAKSWLLGIATIMARRHRRSVGRTLARIAAWANHARREPAQSPAPDELLERERTARRVAAALDRLAHKKRETFVLVVLEGLSGEDAAEALGVPVRTVWTRLHHARRELRALLEEASR